MKKLFFAILLCAIPVFFFFNRSKKGTEKNTPPIGIILPLTHPSLQKIVDGFCSKMTALAGNNYSFLIRDAHGDQAIQQPAIIDEMLYKKVCLMVPIGTLCTQMTVQKATTTPVIGLASSKKSIEGASLGYVIEDEIDMRTHCSFIKNCIPSISKVAIIATQNEKTVPEIEQFRNEALNSGIAVQIIFIQNSSEIYLATHSIDTDVQAIFILKDHAVVSGIATIAAFASERKIPLIASDEGSVEQGACCALGIKEKSIGEHGAVLAYKLLTKSSDVLEKNTQLSDITVFVNKKNAQKQNLRVRLINTFCSTMNYHLEKVKI